MSVQVHLDHPHGHNYTSLDFVTGQVVLYLQYDATISAITVKLEGETRTRLEGPLRLRDQERDKTKKLLEVHKILYRVKTVFPDAALSDLYDGKSPQYTLQKGRYEYPFRFQIPIESECMTNTNLTKDLKVGQLSVQFGQEPAHIRALLPPSLGGYPGEVEVKYYVKATVVRPKFYQENLRNEIPILFLPLERHRPAQKDAGETFGRRKHKFEPFLESQTKRRNSLLSKSSSVQDSETLELEVDARLPNPAVLTCCQPIPLRILVKRMNTNPAVLYLDMLQIEVIGRTEVRAYDIQRGENDTWLLVSLANMDEKLTLDDANSARWTIPSRFWRSTPLPSTVIPTFRTCNISRTYQLEIRVGLKHGTTDGVRPEIIVSPIKLDVEVWSGRPPPRDLPAAILDSQAPQPAYAPQRMNSLPMSMTMPGTFPLQTSAPSLNKLHHSSYSSLSPGPISSGNALPSSHILSRRPSHPASVMAAVPNHEPVSTVGASAVDPANDPPPSYEDALAEDAPVAGGPGGDYVPGERLPAAVSSAPSSTASRKSDGRASGLGRRGSERLFSQNNAQPPSRQGLTQVDHNPYGGDPVPDDGDVDGLEHRSGNTLAHGLQSSGLPDQDYRPPLPARRGSTQARLRDKLGGK